jgi:hypothetical protein
MRTLVILLLLANLTLFAYTRLDSAGGEGVRLKEQVRPDKIKVLSPQEVAALGPASAASLADVCLEWGPFGDADRARAVAELDSLGLSKLVSQKRVETSGGARAQSVAQTLIVVRDPQQPLLVRLRELAPSYPGADAKIGTCGAGN